MKKTGEGKADQLSPENISLWNFDIDGDTVKKEHIDFLSHHMSPFRKSGYVILRGLTSRTGSEAHNFQLAKRRVNAVKKVMQHLGAPATCTVGDLKVDRFLAPDIVGERHNFPGSNEEARHRAVWVQFQARQACIIPPPPPPPPPPPHPPAVIPQTNQFQMRIVSGWDVRMAAPKQLGGRFWEKILNMKLSIEIAAVKNGKRAETQMYEFSGSGISFPGSGTIIGGSTYGKGAWSKTFKIPVWVKVNELGPGMWTLRTASPGMRNGTPHGYAKLTASKRFSSVKFEVDQLDLGPTFKPSFMITDGLFYHTK